MNLNRSMHAASFWRWPIVAAVAIFVVILTTAAVTSNRWLPAMGFGDSAASPTQHDDHDHHLHDNNLHSIALSEQARKNIGLELMKVELGPFERSMSLPGIVIERPGRSTLEVTAPLTGVVIRILPIQGQAVEPGAPLFEIRLTHEELVQAQADLLRTAEELDVIGQDYSRLEKVAGEGVARKALLDRQYEKQRQEAVLRSQQQALLLHGLSQSHIDEILSTRKLLQSLTVYAPSDPDMMNPMGPNRLLQVTSLPVDLGQHVEAGSTLCTLAGHAELYIEGTAFQQDAEEIHHAVAEGWPISAVVEGTGQLIEELKILYIAGTVDVASRALHFYVVLPNELIRQTEVDGRAFVYWRFKPGQRMQLRVPVEKWTDRIVLPLDAVAQDGAEAYVFQPSGDLFVRREVHLEYRDARHAVIANDGSIFPGDTIASAGAQQLQLAIKNRSGGPIDPHAGHNH